MLGQVTKIFLQKFESDGIKYPAGTILVAIASTNSPLSSVISTVYARPTSNVSIPLVNEYVNLQYAPGDTTAGRTGTSSCYYTDIIQIFGDLNNNITNLSSYLREEITTDYSKAPTNKPTEASNVDFVPSSINPIQPFEGDKIIYGRFGNSIRLGGTFKSFKQSVDTNPTWKGNNNGSPITIISNKSNKIENLDTGDSCIFMTSDQTISSFSGAQRNLGLLVTALSMYNKPQIVFSSSRVVLNAVDDFIILNSKKSVILATPQWATDIDTTMTILDGLITQVNLLVTALVAATASGTIITLAAPIVPIQTSLVKIKTQISLMRGNLSNLGSINAPSFQPNNVAVTNKPYTTLKPHDLLSSTISSPVIPDDIPRILSLGGLNPLGFISPMNETDYIVKSKFGPRIAPIPGASTNHGGVDLATRGQIGKPIYAIADGVIMQTGYQSPGNPEVGFGLRIRISHIDDYESVYAHLSSTAQHDLNQVVRQGDIIGYSGNSGNSSGPHLHFELHRFGLKIDPLRYIPEIKTT